jgi:hypothetical protein
MGPQISPLKKETHMSYYLKEGEVFWPTDANAYDVRDHLPVGTYTIGLTPKGYYFKLISDFKNEGKIYGNTTRHAERILSTFKSRPNATGVLLNGEKGSGKTLLAKLISEKAYERNIPTIVINAPHCGDAFNTLLQSIDEPCVIVFDEFEKVYDPEQQEAILTLLDGVYPTKKLFILTVNDKYKVNQHMRNRPGRIFYMLDFKGVDQQFIREYCEDNLDDKSHIETIIRLTMMFDAFNFDMLKALVEEMNRYKETPNQAMEMLNAKPYTDGGTVRHDLAVFYKGQKVDAEHLYQDHIRGNPVVHDELCFGCEVPTGEKDEDGEPKMVNLDLTITPKDLKKIDPETGTFTYVLRDGTPEMTILTFTRESFKPSFSWQDMIS